MNVKLLNKLYTTHSPSKKEKPMRDLISGELSDLNIDYDVDRFHQIYRIIPGKPIMVAHMDQVQLNPCHKAAQIKNRIYGFSKKGNLVGLGADDKNGIYVLLQMIKTFRHEVSFIFSANEESGGYLRHLTDKIDLSDTPYGLIFDRKGSSDIIGTSNNYCCDDLETAIQVHSGKLKYKPASGIFSDADELSNHVPCVNLSVGYYSAHTTEEHAKPSEIFRAVQLAEILLTNLPRKNRPFELAEKWARGKSYGWGVHGYQDFEYMDDDLGSFDDGDYTYRWDKKLLRYISTKKDTTKNTFKSDLVTPDECSLMVDDSGVYLYSDTDEVFISHDIKNAVGSWKVDLYDGFKHDLLIDRRIRNHTLTVEAILDHEHIEVIDDLCEEEVDHD